MTKQELKDLIETCDDENLNYIETFGITNMNYMFYEASSFNSDISGWDVSNVTSWNNIFDSCPIVNDYKPEKFK